MDKVKIKVTKEENKEVLDILREMGYTFNNYAKLGKFLYIYPEKKIVGYDIVDNLKRYNSHENRDVDISYFRKFKTPLFKALND